MLLFSLKTYSQIRPKFPPYRKRGSSYQKKGVKYYFQSKCGVSADASELSLETTSSKGIRRSKSIAEIEFKNESKKSHKRTKSSEQSCQTEEHLYADHDLDSKKIEIGEKNHQTMPKPAQLHPAYISVLLILVGFNFAAFLTYYANSTIACECALFMLLISSITRV